jgi:hypothetical protein
MPEYPRTPSGFYGFLNNRGQVVYTDISNAVLFDGRQFYVMRGTSLPVGQRLPFSMADASLTVPAVHQPAAPRPPNMWQRVNFDYSALLSFAMRIGLVVMMFSQGGDKWRIALMCAVFGLIFLLQAGVVPLNIGHGVNRFWEIIMGARQAAQPQAPGEPVNNDRERPAVDQNPLIKLLEMFTTFLLSLFPTGVPPRPQGVAN